MNQLDRIESYLIIVTLVLLWICAVSLFCVLLFSGCTQTVIERDVDGCITVKVNTLLKDIEFDELWYRDVFGVRKYVGISPEIEVFTPYGTLKTKKPESKAATP